MRALMTSLILIATFCQCRAQEDAVNPYEQAKAYMSKRLDADDFFKRPERQHAVGRAAVLQVYDSIVYIGLGGSFSRLLARESLRTSHARRTRQDSLSIALRETVLPRLWPRDSVATFPKAVPPIPINYNGYVVVFSNAFEDLVPGRKVLLASLFPVTQKFLEVSSRKLWWLRYGNCESDFMFIFDEKNNLLNVYNETGYNN